MLEWERGEGRQILAVTQARYDTRRWTQQKRTHTHAIRSVCAASRPDSLRCTRNLQNKQRDSRLPRPLPLVHRLQNPPPRLSGFYIQLIRKIKEKNSMLTDIQSLHILITKSEDRWSRVCIPILSNPGFPQVRFCCECTTDQLLYISNNINCT